MGYLAEDISNCKAALEMDSFDINSIHFIATDGKAGEIAGTIRLVIQEIPRYLEESIIGVPSKTLAAHQLWCKQIAVDMSEDAFLKRIEHPYFAALPILQSADFKESWPPILQETAKGGELSRLVVTPRYRGLGVSRLLMRTAIATAVDLHKSFLLLECIQMHAQMYSHYGFELLDGHHCRAQELDQIAVGMRLNLEDTPLNPSVSLARRDIQMITSGRTDPHQLFGSKFLCQCRLEVCWRSGAYELRGANDCPLRTTFQDGSD
jgi:GNAT superfamily N-acetyltransferase